MGIDFLVLTIRIDLYSILLCFILFTFWKLNILSLCTHFILSKYNDYKRVTSLVSSREKNYIYITLVSFKLIIMFYYISLLQFCNNSVICIDKNLYQVTYTINGKLYKMLVKQTKGPNPFVKITNEMDMDITNDILPYIGPQYNFHGSNLTPRSLHCKSLTFTLNNGNIYTYQEKDIISFP